MLKEIENSYSNVKPVDFDKVEQNNDKLRPYQIEMKQKIFSAWQEGKKSIMLQMPTGTGKTILFCSIIKDIWDYYYDNRNLKKFLILVHRKELVSQVRKTLYREVGLAHGVIQGGQEDEKLFHIQVAMVHTLARERRLNHWKDNEFDFIICDEAHHFLADDYIRIREAFPDSYLLGVTATPYRLNHKTFTDCFDILLRTKSINDFIKEGWLSEYEYYSIEPTSELQLEIDNLRVLKTGDYSYNAMTKALDNRRIRAGVVKTWLKYAKGKKTIVYTINQDHNDHLCREFNQQGYKCVAIDSKTPAWVRDDYVEKFRKGEITIICNVNIFSEGFDCPDIECIQLARPTRSLSMYLQQVGRGLRIHKGKEKTIFLDNVGLYNRFGLPSANRQWQKHFNGEKEDDKPKRDYPEEVERVRYIYPEEEADDDIEQIYSNVQEKDDRTISSVSEFLGISIEEIISMFKDEIENISPNSVLTEEQYGKLLDGLMEESRQSKGGFVSIFDISDEDAVKKKQFYCKVKNYKTNEWEVVSYKYFINCYTDVVNRVYSDYLFAQKDIDTTDVETYNKIRRTLRIKPLSSLQRYFRLRNGELLETCLSNEEKMRNLRILLRIAKEDMFFNFDGNYNIGEQVNNIEPGNSVTEENKESEYIATDDNKDKIILKDMVYNVDEISEKQALELMLFLHDKVNVECMDEQKIEQRLREIEKEDERQKVAKQIEDLSLTDEEIRKMYEYIQQK